MNEQPPFWHENRTGYLFAGIFCCGHHLLELCSRKTVILEEQIMSKDKYPCIFSLQVEAVVFITRKVSLQRADKMFSNN